VWVRAPLVAVSAILWVGCGRIGYDLENGAESFRDAPEGAEDGEAGPISRGPSFDAADRALPVDSTSAPEVDVEPEPSMEEAGPVDASDTSPPEAAPPDEASPPEAAPPDDASPSEAAPPDGTPCVTTSYCGVVTPTMVYQGGKCVDHSPNWVGGLPSCGEVNALCGTRARCNIAGQQCFATWDCSLCCQ
jgi:hypothetical protein